MSLLLIPVADALRCVGREKRHATHLRGAAGNPEQPLSGLRRRHRAQLRVLVKRVLRKYGRPPDKQEKATKTVLEQAEVLSEAWADAA